MVFTILFNVCKFCSKQSTTLAFWRSDVRHARILEVWGAQSSTTSLKIDAPGGRGEATVGYARRRSAMVRVGGRGGPLYSKSSKISENPPAPKGLKGVLDLVSEICRNQKKSEDLQGSATAADTYHSRASPSVA